MPYSRTVRDPRAFFFARQARNSGKGQYLCCDIQTIMTRVNGSAAVLWWHRDKRHVRWLFVGCNGVTKVRIVPGPPIRGK